MTRTLIDPFPFEAIRRRWALAWLSAPVGDVAVLVQFDVIPMESEVGLIDATWRDYPQWESGEEWVACRAPSLIYPERPPYPGFVVATRGYVGDSGPRTVRVEVWSGDAPAGLRCVHESVLAVGSHGVVVGDDGTGGHEALPLARGEYAVRVLVDADKPDAVSRVVFALGERRHVA